jgi:tetratricopeptide (TPR) repeat protein
MALPLSIPMLLAGLLGVMAAPAWARSPNLCTVERMETDPASVEAPCSARLDTAKLSPKARAEALHIRGKGRDRTGAAQLALQDYEAAIVLQPKNGDLYASRASARFNRTDFEGGVADLQTALQLDERNTRALVSIGNLMIESGQPDGLKLLDKALRIDPKQPFGLLFRLRAYAELGRWQEAFKDADALVALPRKSLNRVSYRGRDGLPEDFHIVALEERAKLFNARRQTAEAEADLNAAVAYKEGPQSYLARATFLFGKVGRETDALRDFDRLVDTQSHQAWFHSARAELLLRLKRSTDALEASERAIVIDDSEGVAYEIRGNALTQLGRFDEAFADFTTALDRDPSLIPKHLDRLQMAGYFPSRQPPTEMTPLLRDALKACSLDPACRER